MSLSDADNVALDSSWQKLIHKHDGKRSAGQALVLWMFETIPNMRAQFSKFNANQSDDALKADPEFNKQVDVIVASLDAMINSVTNSEQLKGHMDHLAKSHVQLKIGLEFFGPLQQHIHSFIENMLGVDAGSDEAKAWTNFVTVFNEILKKA